MKQFNLNHGNCMFVSVLPHGRGVCEIKIGRNWRIVEFNKNASYTRLDIFNKLDNDRNKYSKYDADACLVSITVKNNAVLNRDFFVERWELEQALKMVRKYRSKLYI